MAENEPVWGRREIYSLFTLTGFVGIIGMFLFIIIGSLVASYASASVYLYIFGFTGIGFFVTLLTTRTAAALNSPRKIGYSPTSLFLDSGKEGVSEIGF